MVASKRYCDPQPTSTTPRDVALSIEGAWETGMLESSVTAVGHSWGGLLVQVAVAHMPRRFTRVVLLDATARGFLVEPTEDRSTLAREGWDVDRSVRELDEARRAWPHRLPTFVFVHDAGSALRSGRESRESQALWDADRALLGRLSPATEVSCVAGSTHDLPRELGRALADRLARAATVEPPPEPSH